VTAVLCKRELSRLTLKVKGADSLDETQLAALVDEL